jgi:hypothetical protein
LKGKSYKDNPYRPKRFTKSKKNLRRYRPHREIVEEYRAAIRQCYCVGCGNPPVPPDRQATGYGNDSAHQRFSDHEGGNVNPGIGGLNSDLKVLPLCSWQTPHKCHETQHRMEERLFWEWCGHNPWKMHDEFSALYPDLVKMRDLSLTYALKSNLLRNKLCAMMAVVSKSGTRKTS